MSEEYEKQVRPFYVGVNACGCRTAMLIDDAHTTAKEIGSFAKSMQKTKRKVEHMMLTQQQIAETFKACDCRASA